MTSPTAGESRPGGGAQAVIGEDGVPRYPRPAAQGDDLPEVVEAFWTYEQALMSDDLEAMARLFAPGGQTLRGDAAGLLVSHEEITGFRGARGGAPKRRIVELHVRALGPDHASTVAITELLDAQGAGTGRGQQTQVWMRAATDEGAADPDAGHLGWQCSVAHVMVAPPAFDRRVWRVLGDPLVPACAESRPAGPLAGERVAVKDLFAVAGHRIGAGSPAYLEEAAPQERSAPALERLLEAGAEITGIAATDEFAYSLAGTNTHYGTPPNPRAPRRISGGSSSGSASAVSLGHASIGLGTDTGGSVRVPSAYQGLWGIRTTHDLIPREGVLPLADSFDTIGWMTRTPQTLAAVAEALIPDLEASRSAASAPSAMGGMASTSPSVIVPKGPVAWAATRPLGELKIIPQLTALADGDVAAAVGAAAAGATRLEVSLDEDTLDSWVRAFTVIQGREAWTNHGEWVGQHWDRLAPDVAARFRRAESFSADEEVTARELAARVREKVRGWVGDGVLALPSAASAAPLIREAAAGGELIEAQRQRTLKLTCVAGLAGLPVVSLPLRMRAEAGRPGLPAGLSLVGPSGSDKALIRYAAQWAESLAEEQG